MRVTIKKLENLGSIETFPLSCAPSNRLRIEYLGLKFCAAPAGRSSSVDLYIDDTPNARQIAAIAAYVFNATALAPSSVEAVVDALYELFPQATEFPEGVRVKPGHEPDYLAEVLRKKFGSPNAGEDFYKDVLAWEFYTQAMLDAGRGVNLPAYYVEIPPAWVRANYGVTSVKLFAHNSRLSFENHTLINPSLQIACDLNFGTRANQSEAWPDPKRWVFYATKQAVVSKFGKAPDITLTRSMLSKLGISPYGGAFTKYVGCYATYLGRPSLENASYDDVFSSLKTALESFPEIDS